MDDDSVDAVVWAREVLAEQGTDVLGVEQIRQRAWSTVWRVTTSDGDHYLKTAPDGVAAEPAVLRILALRGVPHVQHPVAVQGNHVLLPDGGPIVRLSDAVSRDAAWLDVMRHYAEVQWATEPAAADDLVCAGVPDVRLGVLPDVATALVDRWAPEVSAALPMLGDAAAELDELLPMATVEHGDLHTGNAFAREAVPFDWGDACVSHPFCSLLVAGREDVPGAVDAYLETFFDEPGVGDDPDVQHLVGLATTLGVVPRVLSWQRAIDASGDAMPTDYRTAPRDWLLTLVDQGR
ncbi:phosphotransferase [Curtobacterium sp. Leaf183]|uniref:phosphotransferase n=1 Tax=Curtobacterium sp. Leaf183 TaxID=1736291 RepID=UPI0012E8D6ED|nr:phosphotransferase [Curtobacterium sp. Leaf183]